MRKLLLYRVSIMLIGTVLYASESLLVNYPVKIQKIMDNFSARTQLANGGSELVKLCINAYQQKEMVEFRKVLLEKMARPGFEGLLLKVQIVKALKDFGLQNIAQFLRDSLNQLSQDVEKIVRQELESYRSVEGLQKLYKEFLPKDVNRILLRDFPDSRTTDLILSGALNRVILDSDLDSDMRKNFRNFIFYYYTEKIREILSSSGDKQQNLQDLFGSTTGYNKEMLENALVEFYKDDLRMSQRADASTTPIKNFCEKLSSKGTSISGDFNGQLGDAWLQVMLEEVPQDKDITEEDAVGILNFLENDPLHLFRYPIAGSIGLKIPEEFQVKIPSNFGFTVNNPFLKIVISTFQAIRQIPKNQRMPIDWVKALAINFSNNQIFEKNPKLWFLFAQRVITAAKTPEQLNRVEQALKSSIPKKGRMNQLKDNIKSWFGEYCSLHRLRLKLKTRNATDADRYVLAQRLIDNSELVGSITGVDNDPEELCGSVRVVLQNLSGQQVKGQPTQLLKQLMRVKKIDLRLVYSEVINRLPNVTQVVDEKTTSLHNSFVEAIGNLQVQLNEAQELDVNDDDYEPTVTGQLDLLLDGDDVTDSKQPGSQSVVATKPRTVSSVLKGFFSFNTKKPGDGADEKKQQELVERNQERLLEIHPLAVESPEIEEEYR